MNKQLEYYDLSFQAYKRIKSMILKNELRAGEKIVQEKLATELGVSRMPLHKAFQMLENELLVESIPRRGIYVKKIDLQEITDAFDCREAIETLAVRRVARNITSEDADLLFQLFAPFSKDPANADPVKYEEADRKFHRTILELSGNKLIIQQIEMFNNIIIRTYQRGLIRSPKETYSEHLAIIEAIARHEPDASENLLRLHFRRSNEKIVEFIKNA
jgi:DNA-binding GntR family transcriptional regulator